MWERHSPKPKFTAAVAVGDWDNEEEEEEENFFDTQGVLFRTDFKRYFDRQVVVAISPSFDHDVIFSAFLENKIITFKGYLQYQMFHNVVDPLYCH